jgi:hypothetical protein
MKNGESMWGAQTTETEVSTTNSHMSASHPIRVPLIYWRFRGASLQSLSGP